MNTDQQEMIPVENWPRHVFLKGKREQKTNIESHIKY